MGNRSNNSENLEARLEKAREKDAAEAAEAAEVAEVADKEVANEDVSKKDVNEEVANKDDSDKKDEKSIFSKIKGFIGGTVEDSVKNLKNLVEKARQSINKEESFKRDKLLAKGATKDLLEAHTKVTKEGDKTKLPGVVSHGPNLNKDTYVNPQNPSQIFDKKKTGEIVDNIKAGYAHVNLDIPRNKKRNAKQKTVKVEKAVEAKETDQMVASQLNQQKKSPTKQLDKVADNSKTGKVKVDQDLAVNKAVGSAPTTKRQLDAIDRASIPQNQGGASTA